MKGVPKYRLHRASGLAVVRLGGKDHYLGKHGTPASRAEYLSRIAEWEASGGSEPIDDATIEHLVDRYIVRCRAYYVKRGKATSSLNRVVRICELLRELYGPMPVARFGVAQFKAIRHQWVVGVGGGEPVSRKVANQYAGHLREAFRWGVEEGIVPSPVLESLRAVASLERGRTPAVDHAKVKPAPMDAVEAVKPLVNRLARAKIELQLLTGMRPGEVCGIRTCDIDRTVNPWVYTPAQHKAEHHEKGRTIPLGPKAQAVLAEHLDDADPTRLILCRANRARKYFEGLPNLEPLVVSYQGIVAKACEKAGVEHWHPHQLRHNAATEVRRRYGVEASQLLLGHARAETTEIYAEKNLDAVSRIAAEIG